MNHFGETRGTTVVGAWTAPANETLTSIYMFLGNGASTADIKCQLRVNGFGSALLATITAGATSASLTGQSVSVNALDKLRMLITISGTSDGNNVGLTVVVF
jgi:hypothetical protein